MKTKTINLYQFSELSESAKQKAIENLWDVNVSEDWWLQTYEDAEEIKLKIKEFDIDRASYVKAEFMISAPETAELIKIGHGKECETHKTSTTFLNALNELTSKHSDINDVSEEDIEELEDEFLKSLCEDYRIMLTQNYEYYTSKEAIIETIEANEYDFDENGNLA
jgi:hypothetical protein